MYKSVLLGLGVIFLVIGIVTVIAFILMRAVVPDKNRKFYIVSLFDENDKECSVEISCVLSILSILGLCGRCDIIAVDCGMKNREKKNLLWAFQREDKVIVCNKETLSDRIFDERDHCTMNGTEDAL